MTLGVINIILEHLPQLTETIAWID
jgi:hypothetical protein